MLQGNEKQPAQIQDYKDYNTDTTVKFIVQMSEENIRKAETEKVCTRSSSIKQTCQPLRLFFLIILVV